MVNIEQRKSKILASHFAAVIKAESDPEEFKDFVHSYYTDYTEYQDLKRWWDDMDALQVIRGCRTLY